MMLLIVALLAEGVDRNGFDCVCLIKGILSPSSRRAWIEIPLITPRTSTAATGRPPRGGRG